MPLCLDDTVTVGHIDCMIGCVDSMSTVVLATAHVFFETHQGECHSTLGMRYGFLPHRRGVFHYRLVIVDVLR